MIFIDLLKTSFNQLCYRDSKCGIKFCLSPIFYIFKRPEYSSTKYIKWVIRGYVTGSGWFDIFILKALILIYPW